MRRSVSRLCLTFGLLAGLAAVSTTRAEPNRSPDQIVKEIEAVKMPEVPPVEQRSDQAVVLKFMTERQAAMKKLTALIGELYQADPKNAKLTELLPLRWKILVESGQLTDALKLEIDSVAEHSENAKLKAEAAFCRALVTFRSAPGDSPATLKAADAFTKLAPKDERGAEILQAIARGMRDETKQLALYQRIVKDYPGSEVALMIQGTLRRNESIGKPFELEFTDAIKGTEISMKTLKGKVLVIDFWATWCPPCVAEMPNMKKLYAQYKDQGVEFIGISLDDPKEEGGLDALKKYVAANEISWPQYYQGKGWKSEFSTSWGISSLPAVFAVDADGKLSSADALGKLEMLIPELLKKAKSGGNAGAGGQE